MVPQIKAMHNLIRYLKCLHTYRGRLGNEKEAAHKTVSKEAVVGCATEKGW